MSATPRWRGETGSTCGTHTISLSYRNPSPPSARWQGVGGDDRKYCDTIVGATAIAGGDENPLTQHHTKESTSGGGDGPTRTNRMERAFWFWWSNPWWQQPKYYRCQCPPPYKYDNDHDAKKTLTTDSVYTVTDPDQSARHNSSYSDLIHLPSPNTARVTTSASSDTPPTPASDTTNPLVHTTITPLPRHTGTPIEVRSGWRYWPPLHVQW